MASGTIKIAETAREYSTGPTVTSTRDIGRQTSDMDAVALSTTMAMSTRANSRTTPRMGKVQRRGPTEKSTKGSG